MRRLFVFAAFLVLLGLTSAFAASFEVQAEDITSFNTAVSISVPDPPDPPPIISPLYMVGVDDLKTTLSDSDQISEGLEPPSEDYPNGQFIEWETEELEFGLALVGKDVKLEVYTNSGSGKIDARIYECDETQALPATGCTELAHADLDWNKNGVQTFPFDPALSDVDPGHRLRLRIGNERGTSAWNLQWGHLPSDRDSGLRISEPGA